MVKLATNGAAVPAPTTVAAWTACHAIYLATGRLVCAIYANDAHKPPTYQTEQGYYMVKKIKNLLTYMPICDKLGQHSHKEDSPW